MMKYLNLYSIRFFCLFISLFLLNFLPSEAFSQTPLDIQVLNNRIDILERKIINADPLIRDSNEKLIIENDGSVISDNDNISLSRIQIRLLQLEQLVESLTGQIEETRYEVSNIRKQLGLVNNDISYRLAVLEKLSGVSSVVSGSDENRSQYKDDFNNSVQPLINIKPSEDLLASSENLATSEDSDNIQNRRFEPDMNAPMSTPVQTQLNSEAESSISNVVDKSNEQFQGSTFGILKTDQGGNPLDPNEDEILQINNELDSDKFDLGTPEIVATLPSSIVTNELIGSADSIATKNIVLPEGTPQDKYDFAFDILRRADYVSAEVALRLFLKLHPQDELSGNAQYWLGETYYVRGDFERAAVEFMAGYQNYSKSLKGPDNLLKLGLSMARLNNIDEACTALSKLAIEYPSANDTIKRRAQTERGRLACN